MEETKNKKRRYVFKPEPSEFAILALYLSGEDDYGATDAKAYGIEKLVDEVIRGKGTDDYEAFIVEERLYLFESDTDRCVALRLLNDTISHIGDYDSRKHTDVHYHTLTEKQLARYREHRK